MVRLQTDTVETTRRSKIEACMAQRISGNVRLHQQLQWNGVKDQHVRAATEHFLAPSPLQPIIG